MNTDELQELFAGSPPSSAQVVEDDDLTALARHWLALRAAAEDAEAKARLAREKAKRAEEALLLKMDEEKKLSFPLDEGLVVAQTSTYYRLPARALEDNNLMRWLALQGGAGMVERTILWQAFTAFCRRLVEGGKTLPQVVHAVTKRTVSLRSRTDSKSA